MYWNRVAKLYDFFENLTNKKVNQALKEAVTKEIQDMDVVLECACGTGMISEAISPKY
ncbi:MAG: hypothetical protein J6D29_03010 [Solobacterium sp.]|nr:hypothetical protein [Solobacterium sp.]